MPGNTLSGWHLVIIILVVVLLFGTSRLPKLSRSVVEALKIFKRSFNEASSEDSGVRKLPDSEDLTIDSNSNKTAESVEISESKDSTAFTRSEALQKKSASARKTKKSQ